MSTPSLASDRLLADFAAHYPGLIRFLTRRTGCAEAARELAHDAWLRVAERRALPAPVHATDVAAALPAADAAPAPRPLDTRAYLYTVAAHLAANRHRRDGRTGERFESGLDGDAPCAVAGGDEIEHRHALRQAVAAVDAALQAMPQRRRDIFLDHRLDGEPQAALAQRHGISVKTVEREVQLSMDCVHAALLAWRGEADAAQAQRRGRRRALSGLLAITGVAVAGLGAAWAWRERVPQFELALATPTGRQLRQPLPDGSTLELDADSRAEVAFHAARRQVRLLSGSAFFAVAADGERPFVVQAAALQLLARAARFGVELVQGLAGAVRVDVAVEAGELVVRTPGGDERLLRPGERLRFEDGRLLSQAREADAQADAAPWRSGWLDFAATPLDEVAQRLQRYHRGRLRVAGEAASLVVVGRVRIAQAGEWLRLLPQSLPVRVRWLPQGDVEIRRR